MGDRKDWSEALEAVRKAEKELREARNRLSLYSEGPTHVNGIRDPKYPCESFELGKPSGDCRTDGHYVCNECVHRDTCEGCGFRTSECECRFSGRDGCQILRG